MAKNREGMVKVLASFYNPIQGRNTLQFRWVPKENISKSKEFLKREAAIKKLKKENNK